MPVLKMYDSTLGEWVEVSGGVSGGFDYTETTNPLVTTNATLGASWRNTTSGEIFICTDNTTDENAWIGQLGTEINPLDIYINNTVLLFHADGVNGSTVFVDSSPSSQTLTVVGDARLSTSLKKYGTASAYFDGTGDSIALTNKSDFTFADSEDFTIEAWFYITTSVPTYQHIAGKWAAGGQEWILGCNLSDLCFFWGEDSLGIAVSTTYSVDTWTHVAIVRNAGTITAYKDGVSFGSFYNNSASNATYTGDPAMHIGSIEGGDSLNGYIDELRVTKGVARYLTTFVPKTTAFSNS